MDSTVQDRFKNLEVLKETVYSSVTSPVMTKLVFEPHASIIWEPVTSSNCTSLFITLCLLLVLWSKMHTKSVLSSYSFWLPQI